mmetsp:Transcript_76940/g.193514  ORF Transcript_76940/g.193514 Transcript_76940/m.193514 type:complete len:205 (-) Transcript_76940:943-1557(-)
MTFLYSAFSFLRCSVASATDLSNARMPFFKTAISSVSVAMRSLICSMAVLRSDTERCNAFFFAFAVANCVPQYSFLRSSAFCSSFNVATSCLTNFTTLSRPTFRPLKASEMKSRRSAPWPGRTFERTWFTAPLTSARIDSVVVWSCKKLAPPLGNVVLNNSNESSSLRILIVSANATTSFARISFSSSWAACLEAQFFFKAAAN